MQVRNPLAHLPTVKRRRARLALSAVAVTAATLGGGLLATALPAYADVTTNSYTIGSPSGAVSSVAASPTTVGAGAATSFEVTFNLPSPCLAQGATGSRSPPRLPSLLLRRTSTWWGGRASRPARLGSGVLAAPPPPG